MFLQSILEHGAEWRVWLRLQLKPDNLAHPAPMPVPNARVTEGLEQGEVLFELVQLHLEELCGSLWVGVVREGLGELVHGTPHCANVVFNLFSIKLKEGTLGMIERGEGRGRGGEGGGREGEGRG